ncbi:MAG: 4-alpha-glucanotransferase, partial [Gammaproteobacteria bacterium]
MSEPSSLRRRADAFGIATSHTEIGGRRRQVPPETLHAVIDALGGSQTTLAELEARREAELAPAIVPSFAPAPVRVRLNAAVLAGNEIEWTLTGEERELAGRCAVGELDTHADQLTLALPALTPGYYTLRITAGDTKAETLLIRAPEKAWLPETPERGYGFSIQLYEQFGPESIGIGDFTDLAGLGEAAGRMGAATLGINPLHALFLSAPERASPYSPNSRLALNPLYLDVRGLPGVTDAMRQRLEGPAFAARQKALNAQALVGYPAVARIKLEIAREAHANFRAAGGDPACERFIRESEPGVKAWARYETIASGYGANFNDWPQALRDPGGAAGEHFVKEREQACHFYYWLQWQADAQLAAAARRAGDAG